MSQLNIIILILLPVFHPSQFGFLSPPRFPPWITVNALFLFSVGDPNSQGALKHLDSTQCSTIFSPLFHQAGKEKRREILRIKEWEKERYSHKKLLKCPVPSFDPINPCFCSMLLHFSIFSTNNRSHLLHLVYSKLHLSITSTLLKDALIPTPVPYFKLGCWFLATFFKIAFCEHLKTSFIQYVYMFYLKLHAECVSQ